MHLSYDGIVFDVVLLENWTREAVYDSSGTDFLYWHHVLDAVVTYGGDYNNPERFPPVKGFFGLDGRPAVDNEIEQANGRGVKFPKIAPNAMLRFSDLGIARKEGDLESHLQASPNLEGIENPNRFRTSESQTPNTLPWTDNELRKRLMVPRRQLLVWTYSRLPNNKPINVDDMKPIDVIGDGADRVVGGAFRDAGQAEFVLVSPLTGVGTDARHGPLCTILDLPTIRGNVNGVYRLRFETWEAPNDDYRLTSGNGNMEETIDPLRRHLVTLADVRDKDRGRMRVAAMPPLLSNRWSMRQEVDPQSYLSTIIIEGKAYFRMDVLKVREWTPDQLRRYFMHPVAKNYVRLPPTVGLLEGGDAVWYKIVDREVMTNFHVAKRLGLISIDLKTSHVFHSGSLGKITPIATQLT